MRTRKIEKFIDSNGKEHTNVIWFGSSGKLKTNVESQIINLKTSDTEISVSNLVEGQKYNINVTSIADSSKIIIEFYNDNNLIDTFNFVEISSFNGVLSQSIDRITISSDDNDDSVNIIFNDISEIVYTNNFDDGRVGIKDNLVQKLSTLQNELWFDYLFGMPITNKAKSKLTIDSFIISTVEQELNIKSIKKFNSKIENKHYFCNMIVETDFGDLEINV